MKFDDISAYSILIPLFVGVLSFNWKNSIVVQFILALIIFGTIAETISQIIIGNNEFVLNTYNLSEIALTTGILYEFAESFRMKKVIVWLGLATITFGAFNIIFLQGFYHFNSWTFLIKAVIFIVFSGTMLLMHFNRDNLDWRNCSVWFLLATLIYNAGALFPYGLTVIEEKFPEAFQVNAWLLHGIFNIIFNILLALSLYYGSRISRH